MTTEIDPIRWTASINDAPELLRAPLAAAAKEGPSSAQMRMLALKLAAVSAGAAASATASTAQASASTAGGVAAVPVAALPFAKIVAAIAVVGVAAWGGVSLLSRPVAPQAQQARATVEASAVSTREGTTRSEPRIEVQAAPADPLAMERHDETMTPRAASQEQARGAGAGPAKAAAASVSSKGVRVPELNAVKPVIAGKAAAVATATREAHERNVKSGIPSEVELLRKARASLAGRPREAYALTEQHREHYPRGVFAQERDALAIEALLRAGDTEAARDLARTFIQAHPNSPHAHRFRETLGLR